VAPVAPVHGANPRFTHVDPFEDTERRRERRWAGARQWGFTHVDPFEDTERSI